MHRGVYNDSHKLNDINQPPGTTDLEYPSTYNYLSDKNKSVGLVNTMNSGHLAEQSPTNFFLLPEPFSTTTYTIPKSLIIFNGSTYIFLANQRALSPGLCPGLSSCKRNFELSL